MFIRISTASITMLGLYALRVLKLFKIISGALGALKLPSQNAIRKLFSVLPCYS